MGRPIKTTLVGDRGRVCQLMSDHQWYFSTFSLGYSNNEAQRFQSHGGLQLLLLGSLFCGCSGCSEWSNPSVGSGKTSNILLNRPCLPHTSVLDCRTKMKHFFVSRRFDLLGPVTSGKLLNMLVRLELGSACTSFSLLDSNRNQLLVTSGPYPPSIFTIMMPEMVDGKIHVGNTCN